METTMEFMADNSLNPFSLSIFHIRTGNEILKTMKNPRGGTSVRKFRKNIQKI